MKRYIGANDFAAINAEKWSMAALVNLEKEGLFVSEFSGKERYFWLNAKFPLYKEVEEVLNKIKESKEGNDEKE